MTRPPDGVGRAVYTRSLDDATQRRSAVLAESAAADRSSPPLGKVAIAPNPFRGSTWIRFAVPPSALSTRLDVFDAAGRRVRRLYEAPLAPGERVLTWDGRDEDGTRAAAGVHFLRLDAGGEITSKSAILLR